MQNELLTTIVMLAAMTLFTWIAWRKARAGERSSWLQQEEARLQERYLDRGDPGHRDR